MCQEGGCGACVVALTKQDLSTKKDKIIAVNSVRFIFHFTYFITYFTSITRLENWKDYFIFRAVSRRNIEVQITKYEWWFLVVAPTHSPLMKSNHFRYFSRGR